MRTFRVVLVEDQAVFRKTIRRILEREPGLTVVAEAENGIAGIEAVEKHRPDVVLMDVSMPVMNGIEATKVIRSRFPGTLVIILSMHSDETITASSCEAGACYHLCKTCSPKEIVAAIRNGHQNPDNTGSPQGRLPTCF